MKSLYGSDLILLLPHAHSFVIGPAVINTHTPEQRRAHVSVLLCGSCGGGGGAQRRASTAASTAGMRHSWGGRPRRWCPARRTCKACQLLGILSATPGEQHRALGGQSAAAAGDAASAGGDGEFVAASPPSPVLGASVFRNGARPGAFSNRSPALGGGTAPPQDALRTVAVGRLPTAVGQPTPGGGGAKSTGKAAVPSFMVSTFSRSVCAVATLLWRAVVLRTPSLFVQLCTIRFTIREND
jgi:hypothetical protein